MKRQVQLYKSFELLFKKIGLDNTASDTDHIALVSFLDSFEDLLRVESNLLMSFDDLLKMKYKQPEAGGLSLTVQSNWDLTQDSIIYAITPNNPPQQPLRVLY